MIFALSSVAVRASYPDLAGLTKQIIGATRIDELISIYSAHNCEFDHIHLSACWVSLGRFVTRGPVEERCFLQMKALVLEPLIRHTLRAAQAGQLGARELSNVAHGAAQCRG